MKNFNWINIDDLIEKNKNKKPYKNRLISREALE
jgi:hypothetical protein